MYVLEFADFKQFVMLNRTIYRFVFAHPVLQEILSMSAEKYHQRQRQELIHVSHHLVVQTVSVKWDQTDKKSVAAYQTIKVRPRPVDPNALLTVNVALIVLVLTIDA